MVIICSKLQKLTLVNVFFLEKDVAVEYLSIFNSVSTKNKIHLHCFWMEAEISFGQIKPKLSYLFEDYGESNWGSSRSQPAEEQQFVHTLVSVYILFSGLLSQSRHSLLNNSLIDPSCLQDRFVFICRTSQKRSVLSTQKSPKRAMKQKKWKERPEDIIIYKWILSCSCSCPVLWPRIRSVLIALSLSLVLLSTQVASNSSVTKMGGKWPLPGPGAY